MSFLATILNPFFNALSKLESSNSRSYLPKLDEKIYDLITTGLVRDLTVDAYTCSCHADLITPDQQQSVRMIRSFSGMVQINASSVTAFMKTTALLMKIQPPAEKDETPKRIFILSEKLTEEQQVLVRWKLKSVYDRYACIAECTADKHKFDRVGSGTYLILPESFKKKLSYAYITEKGNEVLKTLQQEMDEAERFPPIPEKLDHLPGMKELREAQADGPLRLGGHYVDHGEQTISTENFLPLISSEMQTLLSLGLVREITDTTEANEATPERTKFYNDAKKIVEALRQNTRDLPTLYMEDYYAVSLTPSGGSVSSKRKLLINDVAFLMKTLPLKGEEKAKRIYVLHERLNGVDKQLLTKQIFTLDKTAALLESWEKVDLESSDHAWKACSLEPGSYVIQEVRKKEKATPPPLSQAARSYIDKLHSKKDYLPRKAEELLPYEKAGLIRDITDEAAFSSQWKKQSFAQMKMGNGNVTIALPNSGKKSAEEAVRAAAFYMKTDRPKESEFTRRFFWIHPSLTPDEALLVKEEIRSIYKLKALFVTFTNNYGEKNNVNCICLPEDLKFKAFFKALDEKKRKELLSTT